MSKQPIRASFASILASRTELHVVGRSADTSRVQVRDSRNKKVLDSRIGVSMLRAAGVVGAVRATEDTFVVADSAVLRVKREEELAELKQVAHAIAVELAAATDGYDDAFPVASFDGTHIVVSSGDVTEKLDSLKEAKAYLAWLSQVNAVALPSDWKQLRV